MSYSRKGTSALLSTIFTLSILSPLNSKALELNDYVKVLKYSKLDSELDGRIKAI